MKIIPLSLKLVKEVNASSLNNPALNYTSFNGISFTQSLLRALINLGLVVGGVVFIFLIIMGGIQWINSGGDKAAYEQAKQKVTNAFIGLLILFALYAIIKFVETFFGISLLVINVDIFKVGG